MKKYFKFFLILQILFNLNVLKCSSNGNPLCSSSSSFNGQPPAYSEFDNNQPPTYQTLVATQADYITARRANYITARRMDITNSPITAIGRASQNQSERLNQNEEEDTIKVLDLLAESFETDQQIIAAARKMQCQILFCPNSEDKRLLYQEYDKTIGNFASTQSRILSSNDSLKDDFKKITESQKEFYIKMQKLNESQNTLLQDPSNVAATKINKVNAGITEGTVFDYCYKHTEGNFLLNPSEGLKITKLKLEQEKMEQEKLLLAKKDEIAELKSSLVQSNNEELLLELKGLNIKKEIILEEIKLINSSISLYKKPEKNSPEVDIAMKKLRESRHSDKKKEIKEIKDMTKEELETALAQKNEELRIFNEKIYVLNENISK